MRLARLEKVTCVPYCDKNAQLSAPDCQILNDISSPEAMNLPPILSG